MQGAAWHPGSAAECHLVVLARSGVLSLHNVAELEDTTTVLTCDLGRGEDNKVAAALGEVAVASMPYWLILLCGIAILTAAPEIALFLPQYLM